jgi:hypothetical protein
VLCRFCGQKDIHKEIFTVYGGKCFADNEFETGLRKWLIHQSKDFYDAGFDVIVKQWDKYINVGGEYVEKLFFFPQVRISYVLRFIFVAYLLTLPRMFSALAHIFMAPS